MDIGTESEPIYVEPLEDPFEPQRIDDPIEEPVEVPA